MRVVIAGGRDYQFTPEDVAFLDALHAINRFSAVLSGAAKGADECGEKWAESRGIRVEHYPADWVGLGRKAGPIRNQKMAVRADGAILFPGGKGTASMRRCAKEVSLTVWER